MGGMRFTIRHLLWFTLLAAVGCWWWMPSANDAKSVFQAVRPSIRSRQRVESFESLANLLGPLKVEAKIDFRDRDAVLIPADQKYWKWIMNGTLPTIRNRGGGTVVLVLPFVETSIFGGVLISVCKRACVLEASDLQANLIDGGVAAGLLTLAIGSLFVGRQRRPAP